MRRKNYAVIAIAAMVFFFSCGKKHVPESSTGSSATSTAAAPKPAVKKAKPAVPRVITVNDNAAKKSFDGRLYYDLEGRRYWRNYDDGKYYLFNKSMYTDKAYIPH